MSGWGPDPGRKAREAIEQELQSAAARPASRLGHLFAPWTYRDAFMRAVIVLVAVLLLSWATGVNVRRMALLMAAPTVGYWLGGVLQVRQRQAAAAAQPRE